MTPREQNNNLRKSLIESIKAVVLCGPPQGWLPVRIATIDTTETDSEGERTIPDAGMLNEIFETGECSVTTDCPAAEEPYGLCEMTTESLITIWERYVSQAKSQNLWYDHAVSYLQAKTRCTMNEAAAYVKEEWKTDMLFTDNLEEFKRRGSKRIPAEIKIFAYHMSRLDRNATDAEIISDYENNSDTDFPTRAMTPAEFAERINDEGVDDLHYWVRAIEVPIVK